MSQALKRLFLNENTRHVPPAGDDGWDQLQGERRRQNPTPKEAARLDAQHVIVDQLPIPRDPQLRLSQSINLANANPTGGLVIAVRGNCLLYADSTNGTDRLTIQYQDTQGDNSQPTRVMVPGRLRRERYFNFLNITWTVTAGATAILEVYDDPDGALYIQD